MSLQKYEHILENIIKKPAPGTLNLNLGCGAAVLPGFKNIDAYFKHPEILKHDFSEDLHIFTDSSVDSIYSSHALEHIPHRKVSNCINECHRVLKPSGVLYLAVPDLEAILLKICSPDTPEEHLDWYFYCAYGYQIDSKNAYVPHQIPTHKIPEDHGQFHKTGFTERRLQILFEKWEIQEIFKYDGYSTPSIFLKAVKV